MANLEAVVKAHPAYWIIGFLVAVVAGTLTVDSRYAKAEDIKSARMELRQEISAVRSFTDTAFKQQRKTGLEDKLFELETKKELKKINEVELKQYFRYKSELEDLNRELRIIKRRDMQ